MFSDLVSSTALSARMDPEDSGRFSTISVNSVFEGIGNAGVKALKANR
jgi:hypothetical protein